MVEKKCCVKPEKPWEYITARIDKQEKEVLPVSVGCMMASKRNFA